MDLNEDEYRDVSSLSAFLQEADYLQNEMKSILATFTEESTIEYVFHRQFFALSILWP